jgi:mono/diheme cytochrome c family protein
MNIRARLSIVLALPLAVVACGGGQASGPAGAPPASAPKQVSAIGMKQAQELFQSLCSTCHGNSGKGDGPGAQALDPKPRSFGDAAWQASVNDDHLRKVITLGGGAVGKSLAMPPQPQLKSQPEVLDGLISIVRSFKPK